MHAEAEEETTTGSARSRFKKACTIKKQVRSPFPICVRGGEVHVVSAWGAHALEVSIAFRVIGLHAQHF